MDDPRISELKSLLPRAMTADWVRLGARMIRLLRDTRHTGSHDAVLDRLLAQARQSVQFRELRAASVPHVSFPPDLPISSRAAEIVEAIRTHPVVVIAGETGSGKTTQIPKMCLAAGLGIEGRIGCTQPRRVAALSISRRIAEELNVAWGREVGCKIRFDDRSSQETYIKLMTDGILLAETQGDPLLADYNCLILDEAHERSLNIDFLLGYLKGLLARRHDLKLVITSATIDTGAFSRAFNDAPVIEVSGRMYPVEVHYRPPEGSDNGDEGEMDPVEAAGMAVDDVLQESSAGDILVFLPGERDIRECRDWLTRRHGDDVDIIPLFGRLSAGDQQRAFVATGRRKIVIATNIAETSLTIPGIRYVIDSGTARILRYNPRTRTRRLAIEPVSQSSANQRKGRAGRVEAGVCIRLYSEEDFQSRPPYTTPEIQRANLAEVILRMKAFRLGEIETFPFLQPPSPAAIDGGYRLLHELGAIDDARELTPVGRDLARLPIDPTLGRMLLQSEVEHASRELLIIASGLSIQDPRERPLEQRAAADAAHRKHQHPDSDFLTLLNVWNAVHDTWERLSTQNQQRRFCREHFLSYTRMREWQELHEQLRDALEQVASIRLEAIQDNVLQVPGNVPAGSAGNAKGNFRSRRKLELDESNAESGAVHRCVLAGLLGHVAQRTERNVYRASGNRLLTLFPGSALYERGESRKSGASRSEDDSGPGRKLRAQQPEWIVAGEMVETSQLFLRTIAGIDPLWILDLAPHLCEVRHHQPHWSATAGRVLVDEVTLFRGIEIRRRKMAFAQINPAGATAIFIRSALVEENLFPDGESVGEGSVLRRDRKPTDAELQAVARGFRPNIPRTFEFLEHNRRVRERIEAWQTRVRRHDLGGVDEALAKFYARHLSGVASLAEMTRWLRENPGADRLRATTEDLVPAARLHLEDDAFPTEWKIAGHLIPVRYAYAPGESHDGVTLEIPADLLPAVSESSAFWMVPGLRDEIAGELLRNLPKALRRELQPFPPKIAQIAAEWVPAGSGRPFGAELSDFVFRSHGVRVPAEAWDVSAIPAHLKPRFAVVDHRGTVLDSSRQLAELKTKFERRKAEPPRVDPVWQRLSLQWEKFGLTDWTLGDLPESIPIPGGAASAFPGLAWEGGSVNLRLFRTRELAQQATNVGFPKLLESAMSRDWAWLEKDLRSFQRLEVLHSPLGSLAELLESAATHLRLRALSGLTPSRLNAAEFGRAVGSARERLRGAVPALLEQVTAILQLRDSIVLKLGSAVSGHRPAGGTAGSAGKPKVLNDLSRLSVLVAPAPSATAPVTSPLASELAALLPHRFLETTSTELLQQLPRYLKALLLRIERAQLNPPKELERARQLAPYVEALKSLESRPHPSEADRVHLSRFRTMVEEYKVSLFAQELGTSFPVSPKRLDEFLKSRPGG